MWTMIAVEMLSVVGLGHLWTRRVRVGKRLVWTPVVMLPMVGPILYGAIFDGLEEQPDLMRAKPTPGAYRGL